MTWTLGRYPKRPLTVASNPSSVQLASSGEAIPPCGVPACVGKSRPFSTNPALSHCRRTSRSIGACSNSHWCPISSKQALMSPSSTHWPEHLRLKQMTSCSIASCVLRYGRNPYEFGSARHSTIGSSAKAYGAFIARSFNPYRANP